MSEDRPAEGISALAAPPPPAVLRRPGLFKLGPGLITGAADDDPSGIVTYTQAGAAYGFALGWSVVLTLPFMAAVQEISARLGRVSGRGLAATLRQFAPRWLVALLVLLLLVANTINIGADIAAMGEAGKLVAGGPATLWSVAVALFCAAAEIRIPYHTYARVLKFLTLTLFAYVALLFVLHLPAGAVLRGILIPRLALDRDGVAMIVAVFGTTISPYLFFWQAAEEVEEMREDPAAHPLREAPAEAGRQIARIEFDTWTGMIFSNLVALAVIIGAGATLHARGVTSVNTAGDAASALAPIAGRFAELLFALGIFGTGLLAVPVLAGASAYALADAMGWREGLSKTATEARAFYATLAISTLIGLGIAVAPIDAMKALIYSAIINGIAAAPMIVAMLVLGSMRQVMGGLVLPAWLRVLGWAAAAIMALAAVAMLVI
jgi:NRAMP (natural resistance-associated macrophage protein)-like metal ion transporter